MKTCQSVSVNAPSQVLEFEFPTEILKQSVNFGTVVSNHILGLL